MCEDLGQLDEQRAANIEAHQAVRARREAELGHKVSGCKPKPGGSRDKGRFINTTDPDNQMPRAHDRFVQDCNAEAAVLVDPAIVAAEVTNAANDSTEFVPAATASEAYLVVVGALPPDVFAADTGYWNAENLAVEAPTDLLITPMPTTRGRLGLDQSAIERRAEVLDRFEIDDGRAR